MYQEMHGLQGTPAYDVYLLVDNVKGKVPLDNEL